MPNNIIGILNRPTALKEQNKQAEMRERKRGPWLIRNIKWIMFTFFNMVAFIFDALAVTTVFTLTGGNYLLSALSVLPTGVPMLMWEGGWLYPLASEFQKKRAVWGIILSIVSAIVVGACAIVANLGNENTQFWVSFALLVWCVVSVIVHGIWAAEYFYRDPIITREHELQKTIAENQHQSETLRESESLLSDVEKMLTREQELKSRFGENAVNRALEILLGVDLDNNGKIGDREIKERPGGSAQPMREPAYAADAQAHRPAQPGQKEYTLDAFLSAIGMTREEAVAVAGQLGDANAAWKYLRDRGMLPEGLVHSNFNRLYGELMSNPS